MTPPLAPAAPGPRSLGDRLRPYLTLRDVPLWLAGAAFTWLIADGLVETLANPSVAIVVVVVVGIPLLLVIGGRRLLRRRPYSRRFRIFVALVALFAIFALPVQLAFVSFSFLPASLALLAVEIAAKPPPARELDEPIDAEAGDAAREPARRATGVPGTPVRAAPGRRVGPGAGARPASTATTARDEAGRPPRAIPAEPPGAVRRANDDGFDWPEDEAPRQRSLVGRLLGRH